MTWLVSFPYVVFVVVAFWLALTLSVPWLCDRWADWRANREMNRYEREASNVIDLRQVEHDLTHWHEREQAER